MGVDTDYGHPERAFFRKSQTFGLGQTNWAKLSALILVHTLGPLSIFSINQPLILQKKLSLYIHIPNIYLGLGFEFEFGQQRIRD